jgi:hypothetical protein
LLLDRLVVEGSHAQLLVASETPAHRPLLHQILQSLDEALRTGLPAVKVDPPRESFVGGDKQARLL